MQEIKTKSSDLPGKCNPFQGASAPPRSSSDPGVWSSRPGGYVGRRHWFGQHPCPDPGDIPGHLEHERPPLRKREQAPLVERCRHRGRGDSGVAQLLEPRKKRGEPLLLLRRGAPHPLLGALCHHLPGVPWEQPAVIPEVEPSTLPPSVRRGHRAPDVLGRSLLAKLQRATADLQGKFLPPRSGQPYPP